MPKMTYLLVRELLAKRNSGANGFRSLNTATETYFPWQEALAVDSAPEKAHELRS